MFFGAARNATNPAPGPFALTINPKLRRKVWPLGLQPGPTPSHNR
jgi:hypothetical protein